MVHPWIGICIPGDCTGMRRRPPDRDLSLQGEYIKGVRDLEKAVQGDPTNSAFAARLKEVASAHLRTKLAAKRTRALSICESGKQSWDQGDVQHAITQWREVLLLLGGLDEDDFIWTGNEDSYPDPVMRQAHGSTMFP